MLWENRKHTSAKLKLGLGDYFIQLQALNLRKIVLDVNEDRIFIVKTTVSSAINVFLYAFEGASFDVE